VLHAFFTTTFLTITCRMTGMAGDRTKRAFGLIVLAAVFAGSAEECTPSGDCKCPAAIGSATIELGCVSIPAPVVKTAGPCAVCPHALPNGMVPEGSSCAVPDNAAYIILIGNGVGTCHAEITFANGATSSVDVGFMSQSIAACCGGGEAFLPVMADGSDNLSVPDPTCDAGQDAQASD
jgi:hypothetical protein